MTKYFTTIILTSLVSLLSIVIYTSTLSAEQATMVILLDISGSMAGQDFSPNRLEAAKFVFKTNYYL